LDLIIVIFGFVAFLLIGDLSFVGGDVGLIGGYGDWEGGIFFKEVIHRGKVCCVS